jgi:hypothetical protein
MTRKPLRRAGAVWRLLVHRHPTDGPRSDMAYHVQSDRVQGRDDGEWAQTTVLERTELDEVVVGNWLHLEALDTGVWWLNLAGVVITVKVDRDGNPTRVQVSGPGDDDEPRPGCSYDLTWSAE